MTTTNNELRTDNTELRAGLTWQIAWLPKYLLYTLIFNLLYCGWLLLHIPARTQLKGDDILGTLGAALAVACCFVGFRKQQESAREPGRDHVRLLVAVSMFCCFGKHILIAYPDFAGRTLPLNHWETVGIAIASYPLLLLAILRLPSRPLPLASRTRISLDGLMVMTAVITFSWYFLLGPTLLQTGYSLEQKITDVSYMLLDLALFFSLLLQGARSGDGGMAAVVRVLSLGLVSVIGTDSAWAFLSLHHLYHPGSLLDIGWSLGYMPIGLAASAASCRAKSRAADDPPRMQALWQLFLPYAFLPAIIVLLSWTQITHGNHKLVKGIEIGGAVLIIQILLRQVLAIIENHGLNVRLEALATTDPLTGLVNHRAFHVRLNEEADRALRTGKPLAVVMMDLDNFKFFNDTYGHAVGDQVLKQVARALDSCGRSYDTVARFGGDEFALLFPGQEAGRAAGLRAELGARLANVSYRPPGHDMAIPLSLSIGIALFPGDGATRLEALEIADVQLRRVKTGVDQDRPAEQLCQSLKHSVTGFEMLNGLVSAVDTKDRYTRRHSEDVLKYSLLIARELGLDEASCYQIQVASLLHDVGKIGVPDNVLRKPGKLNDDEYDAIKQHAAMGASIVSAVAGFEGTLEAVRHHHERWDGLGYPSGLRAEQTPVLARIMAVADAYSAMTTDRPYRKGMLPAKACGILEEGAGTQWDPACVNAFLRTQKTEAMLVR